MGLVMMSGFYTGGDALVAEGIPLTLLMGVLARRAGRASLAAVCLGDDSRFSVAGARCFEASEGFLQEIAS